MEIKVQNLRYTYKGKKLLGRFSFLMDSSKIIGVTGQGKSLLLEILDLEKKYNGEIFVDGELINFSNCSFYQKQIALISQKNVFFTTTIGDEMKFIAKCHKYLGKDLSKRMVNSLKLVGLSSEFLSRKFDSLSNSEKTLAKIACNLVMNPKVLLLDEPLVGLDGSNKKMILKLLRKLRDRKNRLIVIASNDTDLLYEFTDQMLVLHKGSLVRFDASTAVFKDIKFLQQYHIDVPNLVLFTSLAKEKKVKLSYHRDILDLIKDVYKHV